MPDNTKKFLAIFLGAADKQKMAAWEALPEAERHNKAMEGIAAWKAWAMAHQASIVEMGGPLGKTKKISSAGVEDVRNLMSGYTVVTAASHDEAAALFKNHPSFTIFPGDGVELMPVMPIPGG